MALIVAGISHHTAPLAVRERLAVPPTEARQVLAAIRGLSGVHEGVILSTCNRTEVYAVEGDADAAPAVWSVLSERLREPAMPWGYVRRERDAVTHLYRVASGLDSLILGEAQIQGQVRDAWEVSRAESGIILNRLFQSALLVASRVRTETAVGRGAASVSSAAVQLAKKIFGSLSGRHAMIIGSGDMAELALRCLLDEGVRAAVVANRTLSRAEELALRYGALALHFDDCWGQLHEVDVLICSTAAPHTVVHREQVVPALAARRDRPLCILDIALPRDVEAAVGRLDNVFLYDLDDLRAVADANVERRRQELPTAEQVIAEEAETYWKWRTGLAAVPVLKAFRDHMDRLREEEVAQLMRHLAHLSPHDRDAVEHFSRALMNKMLHEPTVRLRAAAANGQGLGVVDALRYLFALDSGAPREDSAAAGRGARGEG